MTRKIPNKVKDSLKVFSEYTDFLREQLEKIKDYVETHDWRDAKNPEEKFKQQSLMIDNYFKWMQMFSEFSGIVKYYNEVKKEKSYRKGYKDLSGLDDLADEV